jgi:hypothetical protein
VGGGPCSAARGTFNVPTVNRAAKTGGTDVTEWVGIDGATNSSLIQAGPAESVEWIVEAPTSASGEQEMIGAFTPNVIFTNNRFTGTATVKAMVLMVQRGVSIVIPSPMNTGDDFAVADGGGGAITPR